MGDRRRRGMRLMGLDVGDKTIGVAVSDELGVAANPLIVIRRTGNIKAEMREIRAIVEEYNIERIVVGVPLMLDGTYGIQARKVQEFVEVLTRRVGVPVVTWDERLTTVEVEKMLIAADQSRARRKQVIDKIAACVILQSYLDRRRAEAGEVGGDEAAE